MAIRNDYFHVEKTELTEYVDFCLVMINMYEFFFSEPFIEIHNEHTLLSTNPIV